MAKRPYNIRLILRKLYVCMRRIYISHCIKGSNISIIRKVLDAQEDAEDGTDICLQMPPLPFTRVTYSQGIADDPGGQTNQAVASMFHLNTVAVKYGSQ